MKEIVIISGKGGTGKTSVMTALSYLAGDRAVVADCDVDAADVHLLLAPEIIQREEFYSGVFAQINVHAKLGIGAENSGKLVAKVKNEAKRIANETNREYVIVDGAPGVGCPVISSITGADYVVFVTEPTVSGLHDLERVHQVVQKFRINSACIINKSDINLDKTQEIKNFLKKENIALLAELPYNEAFTKAMLKGKTIVEYPVSNNPIKEKVEDAWETLQELVK